MVVHTFTEFLNMMIIKNTHNTKHSGEYVCWHPTPYSHTCAVCEIHEAIAARGSGPATAHFMDGKLLAHTEADNVHASPYGISQKCAQYIQLPSLNNMHIMIMKLGAQIAAHHGAEEGCADT